MNDLKNKFSIFVGLDWANKKHDVCVQIGVSDERSFKVISHTPESIDTWLSELRRKEKGNIAIAVELTVSAGEDPLIFAEL